MKQEIDDQTAGKHAKLKACKLAGIYHMSTMQDALRTVD